MHLMVAKQKPRREKLKCGKQKLKMCDAKYQSKIRRQKNKPRKERSHETHCVIMF